MRIVHLAAEFAPLVKAGGLGEVMVGLCRELTRLGHLVDIIIPKYNFIDCSKIGNLRIEVPDFKCIENTNTMWSGQVEECHLHLLEARHPAGYFHRGTIYGCKDDAARFLYFSRACLEYLKIKKEPIDILHLHDWHVSICAPLVKDLFKELRVQAVLLSIHNMEYQGQCAPHDLEEIGMRSSSYLTPEKLQDPNPKYPHTINLLKGGIVFSDALVPVSPSYAKEILTPEYGFHLDPVLRKRKAKIRGILNGIDTILWAPSRDPSLRAQYEVGTAAKAKQKNKEALCLNVHLNMKKRPWLGAITRLVPQKGPELLEEALKKTVELGGCFLLLGSSPYPKMQEHFNQLKEKYKGHPQVFLHYQYDDPLAHLLYSALDLLIVPSHFEPCGLTQLIALRYGTIPIVRNTGGLRDTIFDWEDAKVPIEKRNGFTFSEPTADSMNAAIDRAFQLFHSDPGSFQSLIRRGMQSDFSWKKPAQEYLKLYRAICTSPTNPSNNAQYKAISADSLCTKHRGPL